ncbi:MAG: SoxR reducing system RseC family protein [Bacteroidetes bacterium]|nr:SoxR reducing system RseC family protein [Bacteroidota bacterium]
MQAEKSIEHQGIIESLRDGIIHVRILAESACISCYAKRACSVAETQEKIIEVPVNGRSFSVGENVKVVLKQSLGFRALFLGYILPLIAVMTVLIVLLGISGNELLAGLIALGFLPPYYLALYLTRDRIKKQFSFRIQKI